MFLFALLAFIDLTFAEKFSNFRFVHIFLTVDVFPKEMMRLKTR